MSQILSASHNNSFCIVDLVIIGGQVNIDFKDEKDMVEKMRIGLALQPVATALFANSPFRDGKDTGKYVQAVHSELLLPSFK